MNLGYFDDSAKEYVITTPQTPLPWINYLGINDFFSLISNTSGGYSFYKDAKLLRITRYRYNNVPLDSNGRYYYIKSDGIIWNPGWQPSQTILDDYECRHGLGYTTIKGSLNGLTATVTALVPLNDACELNKVTIKNISNITKTLSLSSYIEFCLWNAVDDANNFQKNFSTGEVETEMSIDFSTIYHKTEYRERRNHYAFYYVNTHTDGYETDRETFLGTYGSTAKPRSICNGFKNSFASGWSPIGAFNINLTLKPNEEKTFIFMLGFIEYSEKEKWQAPGIINKYKAHKLQEKYNTTKKFDNALLSLKAYWNNILSTYILESPDNKLNRMVNIWNQYQCMVTFNMSRSASYFESGTGRGMGFRDSCQDLLGFVHLVPNAARQRILDIAATQFEDGSAYHQYQPLTKKGNSNIGSGFNDDPLWLIAATSAYIKETGDYNILFETAAFDCDLSKAKPLIEHLRRSLKYITTHLGPHDLPQIGRADWNDCLNLNCFSKTPNESFQTTGPSKGPIAESVFIAAMYVKYGTEYEKICRHTGLLEEADKIKINVSKMYTSILNWGWDGEWFLRAYDATGKKVGSKECDEGKIYIEPQGFCIMAGIGIKEGLADKALLSVKNILDTKYGIVLLQPVYTYYHLELGEISSYPEGYKENGGIFCHNNPWISIAETILGHGNRAFEIYKKICPAFLQDISDLHKTEPYVYSQMIAGKDSKNFGQAKNSWLTGTAAWTFTNISQYILGIRPDFDGLIIDPCIPETLKEYKVTRIFRNATYNITVKNPNKHQKGIKKLTVNGKTINTNLTNYNLIKFDKNCLEYNIIAEL